MAFQFSYLLYFMCPDDFVHEPNNYVCLQAHVNNNMLVDKAAAVTKLNLFPEV